MRNLITIVVTYCASLLIAMLVVFVAGCLGTSELRTESRRSGISEYHSRETWGGASATATAVSWDLSKFVSDNAGILSALLGGPTLLAGGAWLRSSGRKAAERKRTEEDAASHRRTLDRVAHAASAAAVIGRSKQG